MFRRIDIVAALASVLVLAACTSGQSVSATSSGIVPSVLGMGRLAAVTPDKGCGGTNSVKVTPCPVVLTRETKSGIVVTVSGPSVVNSYLGTLNSCFSGKLCYNLERVGDSQTRWRITPGTFCGGADIEFFGVNARGKEVGYTFLGYLNKYCP
jgi:hypothetical protein